jgi:phage gp29-like protein
LYDFTNSTTISDYFLAESNTTNKKLSKYIAGGFLTKDATSKRGVSYKMNITNHIINLIKNDDVINVKLGLVVSEDINISNFNVLRTTNDYIAQVPRASVMNPLGTILYGNTATVPEAKKLKLEIYYTKPK